MSIILSFVLVLDQDSPSYLNETSTIFFAIMNHTDLLNQPLVCRLKRMRFLCLEVFVSPVEIVVMFTYTSQHLDILKLYCSFSYFFSAAPTSDRFVIHRWQQCQTSARSYFQATQFCLDENNYFIIWLPRFHLARGYPLLET